MDNLAPACQRGMPHGEERVEGVKLTYYECVGVSKRKTRAIVEPYYHITTQTVRRK
jgi:hypothetical protein